MDFLLKEGFKQELIDELKEKYDVSILEQLSLEEENVKDVIHYFQKIGITHIDKILLSHIEVFTKDIIEVKDAFLKHNIKETVDNINKDIKFIDFV